MKAKLIIIFIILLTFNCTSQHDDILELSKSQFKILLSENKIDEAKSIGDSLFNIYRESNSELEFHDFDILYKLCLIHLQNRNYISSEEISKYCYSLSEQKFGKDNYITVLFLKQLCTAYYFLNEFKKCADAVEKILVSESNNNTDHQFLIYGALSYNELNDFDNLKRLLNHQIAHLERNQNKTNFEAYFSAVKWLKALHSMDNNLNECLRLNEKLISFYRLNKEDCMLRDAFIDQADYLLDKYEVDRSVKYLDSARIMSVNCHQNLELIYLEYEHFKLENKIDSAKNKLNLLIKKVDSGSDYISSVSDLRVELALFLTQNNYLIEAHELVITEMTNMDFEDPNFELISACKIALLNRSGLYSEALSFKTEIDYYSPTEFKSDILKISYAESLIGVGRYEKSNEILTPLLSKLIIQKDNRDNLIYCELIPLIAANFLGLEEFDKTIEFSEQYFTFLLKNNLFDTYIRLKQTILAAYQELDDIENSEIVASEIYNQLKSLPLSTSTKNHAIGVLRGYYFDNANYKKCLKLHDEMIEYNNGNNYLLAFHILLSAEAERRLNNQPKGNKYFLEGMKYMTTFLSENIETLSEDSRLSLKSKLEVMASVGLFYLNESRDLFDVYFNFCLNYFSGKIFEQKKNDPRIQKDLILLKKELAQRIESENEEKDRINFLLGEIDKLQGLHFSDRNEFNNTITIKNVSENLTADEIYVGIFEVSKLPQANKVSVNEKKIVILTIPKVYDSSNYLILNNVSLLENEIMSNYTSMHAGSNKSSNLKDELSYEYFWKPIAEKVGDAKTIYVSLGGVYNNINLNTLYNPETGKYLLEEKDIRIVNSARDFVLMKEREKKTYSSNTAALFGYPDYDGNSSAAVDSLDYLASTRDLDPIWVDSLTRGGMKASLLPATKTEVENISATFSSNSWEVSSYLESDASETTIKQLASPRVLHIATHGYFFKDIPDDLSNDRFMGMDRKQVVQNPMLRSGLLFTGANKTLQGEKSEGENGLLSAYEAALLDLSKTELVVLSACETGRGEIKNSEGVYGLRKAIADAGAANTIMSLWKVDDNVTQEFMSTFYSTWLSGKTIREAFNETQLIIKDKYPQPYYWGAFVLVGE